MKTDNKPGILERIEQKLNDSIKTQFIFQLQQVFSYIGLFKIKCRYLPNSVEIKLFHIQKHTSYLFTYEIPEDILSHPYYIEVIRDQIESEMEKIQDQTKLAKEHGKNGQ